MPWDRVEADPAVTISARMDPTRADPGWVDATGRRAATTAGAARPPRTWVASTATFAGDGSDGELRLAAAPDGYAYRLGTHCRTTVGWVGPGRAVRDVDAATRHLRHLIEMVAACRFAGEPVWSQYRGWLLATAGSRAEAVPGVPG